MESYYTQLRRDKRGAKQWVAAVVDVLGFFDPSADWHAVEVGLQMLDQADGDVTRLGAELQQLEIVPASSTTVQERVAPTTGPNGRRLNALRDGCRLSAPLLQSDDKSKITTEVHPERPRPSCL